MSAARHDRSTIGGRRRWPGAGLLLVLYPAAWRRRYGDELDALILDMAAGDGTAPWRVRADLIGSAARLRLLGDGDPGRRIRGGASLVLWAWAVFVLAGAVVAKTSEHWQQALPRHGVGDAQAAFDALTVAAIVCAVLVAAGIAVALPAAARFLRDGGWWLVRARALIAVALTAAVVPALVAIGFWAHGLTDAQRNGHDALYGAAVVSWAALGAACLLAWTAVATRIARELRCRRGVLTTQALIAAVVAIAMAAMTVAMLVWWVIVAQRDPAPSGGSIAAYLSALVPQLAFAAVLMVVATAIAALGAVRADAALTEL
ncbi:MAG TPA: hypothetical protein VFW09_00710 [Solirubrobacteraceae bacterium]|nr:hypothetical protein [Solirubrobacteraceae bacterium]